MPEQPDETVQPDHSAQPDLSTTAGKIADLRARYQAAVVDAEATARD